MGDKKNLQLHKYLLLGSFMEEFSMGTAQAPVSDMNIEIDTNKDAGSF